MGIKATIKKEKIVIELNTETIQKLKERAAKEGRTIREIIEAAILKYNNTELQRTELRRATAVRFCSKPFNLNMRELNNLLNR